MRKIKKKKADKSKNAVKASNPSALTWMDNDGFHLLAQGAPPSPDQLDAMTRQFQESIRNSPMWDDMVRQFGKKKAEELLLQCRANLSS
jgi:hypothetical protein